MHPRWLPVPMALLLAAACGSNNLDPIVTGSGGTTAGSGGQSTAPNGGSTSNGGTSTSNGGTSTSNGGASTASGGTGGTGGGTGGAGGVACKRGIAANTPPGAAFSGGIGWWYDWSLKGGAVGPNIEFVPMVWGSADVGKPVPAGAAFLLGFNEPNFHSQSNLTAQQAASYWPTLEKSGLPLVSPAMNFCGPAQNCNGTSPYQYLKDFFAACAGCKVDYVAVHWYNCDLPSLKDYLEPGGNLEGFEQFGKPIWLTELSCDGSASVAEQEAYMKVAIPYLESNPHVYRYSWFSAGPIPNAMLIQADGSPTPLGTTYASLDTTCKP